MNIVTIIIIIMTITNVSISFSSRKIGKKIEKARKIGQELDIELALITYANNLYDEMKNNMEVVKNTEHADYFKLGYRSAIIDLHLILEQDAKEREEQRNEYLHRDL